MTSLIDLKTISPNPITALSVCLRGLTNKATGIILSTDVSLNSEDIRLAEGKGISLEATVEPETATNTTCGFYSTDESVATVSETGRVTAKGYGECDIIATAYDGQSSASSHVTVYCTGFTLPNEAMLYNTTKTLTPAFKSGYTGITNDKFTWESADTKVATIDGNGTVTAKGIGTTTITGTLKDASLTNGKTLKQTCTVTVGRLVESITATQDSYDTYEGVSFNLNATALPADANNKGLTYTSSDTNVATVDETGKVTAVHEGTADITVKAVDGSNVSKVIRVTVQPSIKEFSTGGYITNVPLKANDFYTINFGISPYKEGYLDRVVVTSSDSSVVEITQGIAPSYMYGMNGQFTIKAASNGTADVTVKSKDGYGASLTYTITVTGGTSASAPGTGNETPAASGTGNETRNPNPQATVLPRELTASRVQYQFSGTQLTVTGTTSTKTAVTIPSYVSYKGKSYKVTKIASKAFYKNAKLKKIVIPSTVTSIGSKAFSGCTKLATVSIGSNVRTIGTNAFYGCKSIKSITIPAKVQTIGTKAFYKCSKLSSVTIKSNVLKSVGSNAFKGINKDAEIRVPKARIAKYKKVLKNKYTKGVTIDRINR